jgi:hypothetical protein
MPYIHIITVNKNWLCTEQTNSFPMNLSDEKEDCFVFKYGRYIIQ